MESKPRLVDSDNNRLISSLLISDASYSIASCFTNSIIRGLIKDPEYTMTSALSIRFLALIVISSGSPGPQPTKYTVLLASIFSFCHHEREVFLDSLLILTNFL